MNFRVHMDPKWVHMEAEGRPNGGLGAKPPEKGALGPYWALLDPLGPIGRRYGGPYWALLDPIGPYWAPMRSLFDSSLQGLL